MCYPPPPSRRTSPFPPIRPVEVMSLADRHGGGRDVGDHPRRPPVGPDLAPPATRRTCPRPAPGRASRRDPGTHPPRPASSRPARAGPRVAGPQHSSQPCPADPPEGHSVPPRSPDPALLIDGVGARRQQTDPVGGRRAPRVTDTRRPMRAGRVRAGAGGHRNGRRGGAGATPVRTPRRGAPRSAEGPPPPPPGAGGSHGRRLRRPAGPARQV